MSLLKNKHSILFRRLLYRDNEVLSTLHLEKIYELCGEYITSIVNFEFGILDFKLDQNLLSRGIIDIERANIIFPNGKYVSFNNEYNLQLDISQNTNNFLNPRKIFLTLEDVVIFDKQGETINNYLVEYQEIDNKLTLTESLKKYSIPIIELGYSNNSFYKTDFLGTRVSFKNTIIEEQLALMLQKLQNIYNIELHKITKEQRDLLFLRDLYQAISKMHLLVYKTHMITLVYNTLVEIIGLLGWQNNDLMPLIPKYDNYNNSSQVQDLIKIIEKLLNNYQNITTITKFHYQDNIFTINTKNKEYQKLFIICENSEENNREEIIHWLNNTFIGSESVFQAIQQKRIMGIKRQLINNEKILFVLNLNTEFFIKGEKLCIQANEKINCNLFLSYE